MKFAESSICVPFGGETGCTTYPLTRVISFSHIRLSAAGYSKANVLSFVKQLSASCIDLRLQDLNWLPAADLRRLLAHFRSLVSLHTGNVSLSKRTLIDDVKHLFPFLKYVTLSIPLDGRSVPPAAVNQSALKTNPDADADDDLFHDVCSSLSEMDQLEYVSFVLSDRKGETPVIDD